MVWDGILKFENNRGWGDRGWAGGGAGISLNPIFPGTSPGSLRENYNWHLMSVKAVLITFHPLGEGS